MAITLVKFRVRQGVSTDFSTANPLLLEGEPAFETDTGLFKIGDGGSDWENLPYTPISLMEFHSNTHYKRHQGIIMNNKIYTAASEFVSGNFFEVDNWNQLGILRVTTFAGTVDQINDWLDSVPKQIERDLTISVTASGNAIFVPAFSGGSLAITGEDNTITVDAIHIIPQISKVSVNELTIDTLDAQSDVAVNDCTIANVSCDEQHTVVMDNSVIATELTNLGTVYLSSTCNINGASIYNSGSLFIASGITGTPSTVTNEGLIADDRNGHTLDTFVRPTTLRAGYVPFANSNHDVALEEGSKLLSTDSNETEHELIGLNEYSSGKQIEVGSETDALCINHNALGWDGTPQPTENRIPVNIKDVNGNELDDSLPLYNQDIVPLKNIVDSLVMGGNKIGSFTTKTNVPTNVSGFPGSPKVNDFITVQADETQGGARTQYYISAINSTSGVITWTFDGAFENTEEDILVTNFAGTSLATAVPNDGKVHRFYYNASTLGAPSTTAGSGLLNRVGNNVGLLAMAFNLVWTGYAITTSSSTPTWTRIGTIIGIQLNGTSIGTSGTVNIPMSTELSGSSTNEQTVGAKTVYDYIAALPSGNGLPPVTVGGTVAIPTGVNVQDWFDANINRHYLTEDLYITFNNTNNATLYIAGVVQSNYRIVLQGNYQKAGALHIDTDGYVSIGGTPTTQCASLSLGGTTKFSFTQSAPEYANPTTNIGNLLIGETAYMLLNSTSITSANVPRLDNYGKLDIPSDVPILFAPATFNDYGIVRDFRVSAGNVQTYPLRNVVNQIQGATTFTVTAANLQNTLNNIPRYLTANVTINITGTVASTTALIIPHFVGEGLLIIQGPTTIIQIAGATAIYATQVRLQRCILGAVTHYGGSLIIDANVTIASYTSEVTNSVYRTSCNVLFYGVSTSSIIVGSCTIFYITGTTANFNTLTIYGTARIATSATGITGTIHSVGSLGYPGIMQDNRNTTLTMGTLAADSVTITNNCGTRCVRITASSTTSSTTAVGATLFRIVLPIGHTALSSTTFIAAYGTSAQFSTGALTYVPLTVSPNGNVVPEVAIPSGVYIIGSCTIQNN